MNKKEFYYLLFIAALFLLIISPMWLSDGMFMDGIYYATIARNWAEGLGSFWKPQFTETLGNPFYDHPPLAFFLEGLFFKLLGDHYWVERIYSFLSHVILALLLYRVWGLLVQEKYRSYFWLPLLLWVTVSKVTWSACNNLLENTLMLFTTASILFALKHLKHKQYVYLFLAGFCLFLGFLTKGFVAFFPLSLFFFYFLFQGSYRLKEMLIDSIVMLLGLAIPFFMIYFFWAEARDFIDNYIQIQVLASLNNAQNVDSRLFIIGRFFEESLVMTSLLALLWILNRFKFKLKPFVMEGSGVWIKTLLALGFSGIIPICISLKQSTFYINPVFPIFALAFGLLVLKPIHHIFNPIHYKSKGFAIFRFTSIVLFILGLSLSFAEANHVNRDKKRLKDIRAIINTVPRHETLFISFEIYREWSLYAYFYRYGHVSLDAENPENYHYMIKQKDQFANIPEGFIRIRSDLNELDLYERE